MKLTKAHIALLQRMANRKQYDGPESGPEMSRALGHARYWASSKLASMKSAGLVTELGATMTGGYCFAITDAGRKALEESKG